MNFARCIIQRPVCITIMAEILAWPRGRNKSTRGRRYRKDERISKPVPSFAIPFFSQISGLSPHPSLLPYKEIVVKGRRNWKVAGKAGEFSSLSLSFRGKRKGMVINRRQKFAADFDVWISEETNGIFTEFPN